MTSVYLTSITFTLFVSVIVLARGSKIIIYTIMAVKANELPNSNNDGYRTEKVAEMSINELFVGVFI